MPPKARGSTDPKATHASSGKKAAGKPSDRPATDEKKKGKASLKSASTKQARADILANAREAKKAKAVAAARNTPAPATPPSAPRKLVSALRSSTSTPSATPPAVAPAAVTQPPTPPRQPVIADNTSNDPKTTGWKHHNVRTYFEFNVKLGANNDPSSRYIALVQELLDVLHKLDATAALIPLDGKGPSVGSAVPLPESITGLQNYIDITSKAYKFDEAGEEQLYGIMRLGHDMDAQTLKQKTELELGQQKMFMYIKEVQSQKTGKCMMLFCVNNTLCIKALQSDIKEQLEKVAEEKNSSHMDDDDEEALTVPDFSIRLSKAWLKVAQTDNAKGGRRKKGKHMQTTLTRLQRICHFECADDDADNLIAVAMEWKRKGGVQTTCGRHAHLSACLDVDASPREWKLLHRFNRNNTDFNGSTLLNSVEGLSDPDREVTFTRDNGEQYVETVKEIMLDITVDDNMPLFLAMHNRIGGYPELCYPSKDSYVELAERVLEHPAAWLYHVFKDQWTTEEMTEVMKAFDDDARAEVSSSTFDAETQTVFTSESKEEEDHCASFEAASWRVDMTAVSNNSGSMEDRPNPNAVVSFNFDDGASFGTIHHGSTAVHNVDAEERSPSTPSTMRSAEAIERKRKENELLAQVAALKEQLERQSVEQPIDNEDPKKDGENTGDQSGDGRGTPAAPDENQEAGEG